MALTPLKENQSFAPTDLTATGGGRPLTGSAVESVKGGTVLPGFTPPRMTPVNSLNPDSGPPFAVYTVEISAEGYTPLTALYIAMFSGVPTMLPVALTPLKENQSFAPTDLTATGTPQALDPALPENP